MGRCYLSIAKYARKHLNLKKDGTKKNVTGVRFGKLVAIKPLFTKVGGVVWLWNCDCGGKEGFPGKKEIVLAHVIGGVVKSCSCLKSEKQFESIRKRSYRAHIMGAKNRGIISYLTYEEYSAIASLPCTYCEKFSIRKNTNTGATIEFNSVDRINNEPYYKIKNSQSVCFDHQFMEGSMSDKRFRDFVLKTAKFINKNK